MLPSDSNVVNTASSNSSDQQYRPPSPPPIPILSSTSDSQPQQPQPLSPSTSFHSNVPSDHLVERSTPPTTIAIPETTTAAATQSNISSPLSSLSSAGSSPGSSPKGGARGGEIDQEQKESVGKKNTKGIGRGKGKGKEKEVVEPESVAGQAATPAKRGRKPGTRGRGRGRGRGAASGGGNSTRASTSSSTAGVAGVAGGSSSRPGSAASIKRTSTPTHNNNASNSIFSFSSSTPNPYSILPSSSSSSILTSSAAAPVGSKPSSTFPNPADYRTTLSSLGLSDFTTLTSASNKDNNASNNPSSVFPLFFPGSSSTTSSITPSLSSTTKPPSSSSFPPGSGYFPVASETGVRGTSTEGLGTALGSSKSFGSSSGPSGSGTVGINASAASSSTLGTGGSFNDLFNIINNANPGGNSTSSGGDKNFVAEGGTSVSAGRAGETGYGAPVVSSSGGLSGFGHQPLTSSTSLDFSHVSGSATQPSLGTGFDFNSLFKTASSGAAPAPNSTPTTISKPGLPGENNWNIQPAERPSEFDILSALYSKTKGSGKSVDSRAGATLTTSSTTSESTPQIAPSTWSALSESGGGPSFSSNLSSFLPSSIPVSHQTASGNSIQQSLLSRLFGVNNPATSSPAEILKAPSVVDLSSTDTSNPGISSLSSTLFGAPRSGPSSQPAHTTSSVSYPTSDPLSRLPPAISKALETNHAAAAAALGLGIGSGGENLAKRTQSRGTSLSALSGETFPNILSNSNWGQNKGLAGERPGSQEISFNLEQFGIRDPSVENKSGQEGSVPTAFTSTTSGIGVLGNSNSFSQQSTSSGTGVEVNNLGVNEPRSSPPQISNPTSEARREIGSPTLSSDQSAKPFGGAPSPTKSSTSLTDTLVSAGQGERPSSVKTVFDSPPVSILADAESESPSANMALPNGVMRTSTPQNNSSSNIGSQSLFRSGTNHYLQGSGPGMSFSTPGLGSPVPNTPGAAQPSSSSPNSLNMFAAAAAASTPNPFPLTTPSASALVAHRQGHPLTNAGSPFVPPTSHSAHNPFQSTPASHASPTLSAAGHPMLGMNGAPPQNTPPMPNITPAVLAETIAALPPHLQAHLGQLPIDQQRQVLMQFVARREAFSREQQRTGAQGQQPGQPGYGQTGQTQLGFGQPSNIPSQSGGHSPAPAHPTGLPGSSSPASAQYPFQHLSQSSPAASAYSPSSQQPPPFGAMSQQPQHQLSRPPSMGSISGQMQTSQPLTVTPASLAAMGSSPAALGSVGGNSSTSYSPQTSSPSIPASSSGYYGMQSPAQTAPSMNSYPAAPSPTRPGTYTSMTGGTSGAGFPSPRPASSDQQMQFHTSPRLTSLGGQPSFSGNQGQTQGQQSMNAQPSSFSPAGALASASSQTNITQMLQQQQNDFQRNQPQNILQNPSNLTPQTQQMIIQAQAKKIAQNALAHGYNHQQALTLATNAVQAIAAQLANTSQAGPVSSQTLASLGNAAAIAAVGNPAVAQPGPSVGSDGLPATLQGLLQQQAQQNQQQLSALSRDIQPPPPPVHSSPHPSSPTMPGNHSRQEPPLPPPRTPSPMKDPQASPTIPINGASSSVPLKEEGSVTVPKSRAPVISTPLMFDPSRIGSRPGALPVAPLFTRLYPLSDQDPFPASLNDQEQIDMRHWTEKDMQYTKDQGTDFLRLKETMEITKAELEAREDWLGRRLVGDSRQKPTGMPPRLKFPNERAAEQKRGKRGPRPIVNLSKSRLQNAAEEEEILVPIRLDLEHDNLKLRDTFTWNLSESSISIEDFATILVADLQLPMHPFHPDIVSAFKSQLDDFKVREEYYSEFGTKRPWNVADDDSEDERWWNRWRKKVKRMEGDDDADMETDDDMEDVALDKADEMSEDQELRIPIKLDITLDNINLIDQFDWDIADRRNSPEEFAEVYATDLGVSGEFKTAIAHAIREQIEIYVKSLFLDGWSEGEQIRTTDLRDAFLPQVTDVYRYDNVDFTPRLEELTPDEIERNERERERQTRRTRRQTRGRNRAALPDRDVVPTHRTLVPKPGGIPPSPFTDANGDVITPQPDAATAFPIVRPDPGPKPHWSPGATPPRLRAKASQMEQLATPDPFKTSPAKRLARSRLGNSFLNGSPDTSGVSTPVLAGTFLDPAGADLTNSERFQGSSLQRTMQDVPSRSATGSPAPNATRQRKGRLTAEDLGLHPNIIDGVWHCMNCGAPDSLAKGRRKGPGGNNTLCGPCGKHFHRYKKMRPVEYTTEIEHHQKIIELAEKEKNERKGRPKGPKGRPPKVKPLAAPVNSEDAPAKAIEDDGEDEQDREGAKSPESIPSTPSSQSRSPSPQPFPNNRNDEDDGVNGGDQADDSGLRERIEKDGNKNVEAGDPIDQGMADGEGDGPPAGSQSEEPASSSQPEANGLVSMPISITDDVDMKDTTAAPAVPTSNPSAPPPRPASLPRKPMVPLAAKMNGARLNRQSASPAPQGGSTKEPPAWLRDAAGTLRKQWPHDRFDIIPRPNLEGAWRIRCLDCPGRLYNPGPGNTLANFYVHIKNRAHRSKVEGRMYPGAASNGTPSTPNVHTGGGRSSSSASMNSTPTPTPSPIPNLNTTNLTHPLPPRPNFSSHNHGPR